MRRCGKKEDGVQVEEWMDGGEERWRWMEVENGKAEMKAEYGRRRCDIATNRVKFGTRLQLELTRCLFFQYLTLEVDGVAEME